MGQYVVDVPSFDTIASSQLRLSGGKGAIRRGMGGGRNGGGVRGGGGAGSGREAATAAGTEQSVNYFIVDEIGKMELFSSCFKNLVSLLFDSSEDNGVRVVATIPVIPARGQPNPFIEKIRGRKDVLIFTVTRDNRDAILADILADL